MERLVITAQDPILDIAALPLEYTADRAPAANLLPGGTLAERMDAYEAQIIGTPTSAAAPRWPWQRTWGSPRPQRPGRSPNMWAAGHERRH